MPPENLHQNPIYDDPPSINLSETIFINRSIHLEPALCSSLITSAPIKTHSRSRSSTSTRAGWFLGLTDKKQVLPEIAASWQARILQHECDHLDGTLYVDKMVPRMFRTVENLDLPLANGCPKLGVRLLS